MRVSLVLTVIADDKPGVVEQLSDQILGAGANWEESRMARLAGKFAGLLRVSIDEDGADALTARLRTLAPLITVVVARSGEGDPLDFRTLYLELLGHDRPGIVRDISRVLAQHQVNIEELETDTTTAPMSGEALFRARATLRIPSMVTIEQLRRVLESLAGELMVDLMLDADHSVAK
jgi:glycine cleavage system regulatory protein